MAGIRVPDSLGTRVARCAELGGPIAAAGTGIPGAAQANMETVINGRHWLERCWRQATGEADRPSCYARTKELGREELRRC